MLTQPTGDSRPVWRQDLCCRNRFAGTWPPSSSRANESEAAVTSGTDGARTRRLQKIGTDCAKLLATKTILKLPVCSKLTCNRSGRRDIVQVCIRTSRSKNPTKRYSLASKRKWMSRAWPNPREKKTSTTPRCRSWKSCRNPTWVKSPKPSVRRGMLPREENNGKANQTSS
jgi:hypothetical protein